MLILTELALSQRRPSTTNQRQRTVTSVEWATEGQGLRPARCDCIGLRAGGRRESVTTLI
jgi:hypothetical protein